MNTATATATESTSNPTSPLPNALVTLRIHSDRSLPAGQPMTVGVPFARGVLHLPLDLVLSDDGIRTLPVQTQVLASWIDGSIQWLLLDFLLPSTSPGTVLWHLMPAEASSQIPRPAPLPMTIVEDERSYGIQCVAERTPGSPPASSQSKDLPPKAEFSTWRFQVGRHILNPVQQVMVDEYAALVEPMSRVVLLDDHGHPSPALIHTSCIETQGPVRSTLKLEGAFGGNSPCRFVARLSFWQGTGLVRLELTLHNPRRAKHPGGLWDLGDAGSYLFQDLSLELTLHSPSPVIEWQAEPALEFLQSVDALELYQDSSGGEHWNSTNHVNAKGDVPLQFRGYRATVSTTARATTYEGQRATPVVRMTGAHARLTCAVPEFWQQFPKALECSEGELRVRLFPRQCNDLFELQGGEQKTHTVWMDFHASHLPSTNLAWAHSPSYASVSPHVLGATQLFSSFLPDISSDIPLDSHPISASAAPSSTPDRLEVLLNSMLEGPGNYFDKREIIDEYGWRHFGDIYADHENLHFPGKDSPGKGPVISHFNNQYDFLNGLLLNLLRSGDVRWRQLAYPLARHVMDIDIYHTQEDKAAYNGGLFWHTDHYLDAATCSHRTFSKQNINGRKGYGGGPGAQHNATTGLRLYYYLTGDPAAKEAVLELAGWVAGMDDGERNILSVLNDAPTGWATSTFDFFGPGRGAGYSLTALTDAWMLTGDTAWRDKAEALIQRTVHPNDAVSVHDLLNAEPRWSYTIFLVSLARYLECKAERLELDRAYAYAQAALVRYATWMLEHETPYFDRKETLIYPTETWMGQEMRKANVLRLAAQHVDDPLRAQFLRRGEALANRAWEDLLSFESRTVCRSMAIWTQEGLRDARFCQAPVQPMPRVTERYEFGAPQVFVPQRQQLKRVLTDPTALVEALTHVVDPRRWLRLRKVKGSLKP